MNNGDERRKPEQIPLQTLADLQFKGNQASPVTLSQAQGSYLFQSLVRSKACGLSQFVPLRTCLTRNYLVARPKGRLTKL